jgi:hypothetical protein
MKPAKCGRISVNEYSDYKPNFRGFVETNSSRQLNNVSSFVDPFLAVESFDP